MRTLQKFYGIVMLRIMVDTLTEIEQPLKCSKVVFIGPLSLKMLMTLSRDVTNVMRDAHFIHFLFKEVKSKQKYK
ncbi:hypothetical protein PIB30_069415, partial [Stylosanthes scabra]|nr:hypothetical protein [Stylosanthes scabra]